MPKLNIEQPHNYSAEEARTKLDPMTAKLAQYGVTANWSTPTHAEIKGTGLKGTITIEAQKVAVFLDLGMMLIPMKGKIEEQVKKGLAQALA
jgi:putative polyhydroxyalkanoate system protein